MGTFLFAIYSFTLNVMNRLTFIKLHEYDRFIYKPNDDAQNYHFYRF